MSSQFAQNEIRDILVAWIIVSIALSFASFLNLLQGIGTFTDLEALAASGIAAATAFIIHEMGHKFVAQRYNYVAHFQMWRAGLLLLVMTAVISSLVGGFFLFGAPGAVYIAPAAAAGYYGYGYYSTNQRTRDAQTESMWISLAGPALNLTFAAVFFSLFLGSGRSTFAYLVSSSGLLLNLGLGSFNMLPVPPLDGYKVFRKSIPVALAVALPLWVSFYLLYFA